MPGAALDAKTGGRGVCRTCRSRRSIRASTAACSTPAMRAVFSDEARLQRMLDVEAALARAQAQLGLCRRRRRRRSPPRPTSRASIWRRSARHRAGRLSHRAARQGSEPGVRGRRRSLRALGRDDPGHHRHRARAAAARRLELIRKDLRASRRRSRIWRAVPGHPDGRAHHTQHALPITFGFKCALWLARCSVIPPASRSAARSRSCSSVARWARSPRSARTASA